MSVTSPSNTVTDAIPGVTFQLLATTSTPVQVQITDNTTDIAKAISDFVSAYNTVIGDMNTEEQSGSGGNSAPLLGSPIIAQLQESLRDLSSLVRRVVRSTTSPSWDRKSIMTEL